MRAFDIGTRYFPHYINHRIVATFADGDACAISLQRTKCCNYQICKRKAEMSEESAGQEETVRFPIMQRILDNPFVLLFVGVVVPAVFYIIWGIMEIVTIPIAN